MNTIPKQLKQILPAGHHADIVAAYDFAERKHREAGQVRKFTLDPYIVHPLAVATLVASVRHTPAMLMAALLHDVVEDCGVTRAELSSLFGEQVADLVMWLSDISKPQDGNRAARKAVDRQHIAEAPAPAKTIKLADVIENTSSVAERDPSFARVYIPEKAALLAVLREGDHNLWLSARDIVLKASKRLSLRIDAADLGLGEV